MTFMQAITLALGIGAGVGGLLGGSPIGVLCASIAFGAVVIAKAIEARRAETVKQGSVEDESAVPERNLPNE